MITAQPPYELLVILGRSGVLVGVPCGSGSNGIGSLSNLGNLSNLRNLSNLGDGRFFLWGFQGLLNCHLFYKLNYVYIISMININI
jgi:hypothetical protein